MRCEWRCARLAKGVLRDRVRRVVSVERRAVVGEYGAVGVDQRCETRERELDKDPALVVVVVVARLAGAASVRDDERGLVLKDGKRVVSLGRLVP